MKKLFISLALLGLLYGVEASEVNGIDLSKSYHVATVMSYEVYDVGYRKPTYYKPTYYKKVHYYKKPIYVYKKKRYKNSYKKRYKVPKLRATAPILNNAMKIQLALKKLGFYKGNIDGNLYSYETKRAIKKMHKEYGKRATTYLNPKEKDNLIYLGTLFNLNKVLMLKGSDEVSHYKRIQAALKIEGFYHNKIDGISGTNTRRAIYSYKDAKGLVPSYNLSFQEESNLLNSAKAINDKNIEETISTLSSSNSDEIE